jgi:colicin import membrane protein
MFKNYAKQVGHDVLVVVAAGTVLAGMKEVTDMVREWAKDRGAAKAKKKADELAKKTAEETEAKAKLEAEAKAKLDAEIKAQAEAAKKSRRSSSKRSKPAVKTTTHAPKKNGHAGPQQAIV